MQKLNLSDILAARKRLDSHIHNTPILSSNTLNNFLGHQVFFKAECFQKIGAFKARGALNTIAWLVEEGKKPSSVVANSSGNHAQAVAWAARQYQISATIYMPEDVSTVKMQATKAYGANVVLCKKRQEVDEKTEEHARQPGVYWVPPFNHNHVVAGQGTAAHEALQDLENVDAVFAPCGGGGLLSGTLISTRVASPKTKIIGAEPALGNDAFLSFKTGKLQKLAKTPDTLADGARTLSIGDITLEYIRQLDDFYEIEEQRIVYWVQWLSHLLKAHIEPTSALAMEAAFKWLKTQPQKRKVLVVISGGNVDASMMGRLWEKDYLTETPSF